MTEYFVSMGVRYRRFSPSSGEGWNQPIPKAYPHRYTQSTKSKSWTAFEVSPNLLYLAVVLFLPLSTHGVASSFSLLRVLCLFGVS